MKTSLKEFYQLVKLYKNIFKNNLHFSFEASAIVDIIMGKAFRINVACITLCRRFTNVTVCIIRTEALILSSLRFVSILYTLFPPASIGQ